jgi:Spy/CpxP family protein refolding chaperone
MNRSLQWKLIAGFVLVFIAGGVTGAFFVATQARHLFFASPHHGIVADRMRERLQRELHLTPDQVTKISPIIDKAGAELEDIRRYSGRRVHETFHESHEAISQFLTDDQRQKLHQMEDRHRRWRGGPAMFRDRGRGGPMRHHYRSERARPTVSGSAQPTATASAAPSP